MKKKIFLLLVIQVLFFSESLFSQISFQKTVGTYTDEYGTSVHQTTDGGYIIGGNGWGFATGHENMALIKTNAYGDTLWLKYLGEYYENGNSVEQTTDGGYIIAGSNFNTSGTPLDVFLIKTDANGNPLWSKTFGEWGDEGANSVQQTSDGGYIIGGHAGSFAGGNMNFYLIKTDANGDSLWTKIYGEPGIDYGYSARQSADGGYAIVGVTSSSGAGQNDVYLVKADPDGDILWAKTYGGVNSEMEHSIQQTFDGGYIITGTTNSFGAGLNDIYLIRTDSVGDLLWTKTFGGTGDETGNFVQQTADGGYIIIGNTNSFGGGAIDVYLVRTDANGDSLWTRTFGGTGSEEGHSVEQTTDGGYIITGMTFSFGTGNKDIYIIKTDSGGNLFNNCHQGSTSTIVTTPATQVTNPQPMTYSGGIVSVPAITIHTAAGYTFTTTVYCSVGINEIKTDNLFLLSPNPFSNEIDISTTVTELSEIILYDITSRKLLQQTFSNSASINTSQLSKGIYLFEVRNKNGVFKKGKAVKE